MVLVAALILLVPAASASDDLRDPANVTAIFDHEGCQIVPGGSCDLVMHFTNPFGQPLNDTNLTIEIYRYSTVEEARDVTDAWPYDYPALNTTGVQRLEMDLGDVPANLTTGGRFTTNLTVTLLTSVDMPHGSPVSQGSYFLRFWMEFLFPGEINRTQYASWSHFSRETLITATTAPCPPPWCRGDVNLTYLGIDGLLPDAAFGVREGFPSWPLYVLAGGTIFFLLLGLAFHAEENPDQLPKTARVWASLKGKLIQAVPRRRRL